MAEEAIGIHFRDRRSNAVAAHEVLRYRSASLAADQFLPERSRHFYESGSLVTPWKPPDNLSFRAPAASQFECACATERAYTGDEVTVCGAVGQYGEFLSKFSIRVPHGETVDTDLEAVLITLDERITDALHSQTPSMSIRAPTGIAR